MRTLPARHPHVIVEILGGKHDGRLFDSHSGDATERELVAQLLGSSNFREVERVTDGEGFWVQLRHRE